MFDISVIILAYNEEIHLERCLNNARKFAKEIFVIDSFSTDKTVEIAEKMGAKVYKHAWENYSKQLIGDCRICRLLRNGYGVWMRTNICRMS